MTSRRLTERSFSESINAAASSTMAAEPFAPRCVFYFKEAKGSDILTLVSRIRQCDAKEAARWIAEGRAVELAHGRSSSSASREHLEIDGMRRDGRNGKAEMSRGLGATQKAVLGLMLATPGGDPVGCTARLADGYHDMRRIGRDLARLQGVQVRTRHKWHPRFSRAVRTLEARGIIEFPGLVRVSDDTEPDEVTISRLSDGTYILNGNRRQRRFCRVLRERFSFLDAYYEGLALVEQLNTKARWP